MNLTEKQRPVLTTLYNMLSGYFKTTKTEILSCFKKSEHNFVKETLDYLEVRGIIYKEGYRYYIRWDLFNDAMINNSYENS